MNKCKIVNLTPHTICLYKDNGNFEEIKSSGVARCNEETTIVEYLGTIPVCKKTYGEIYGLPDKQENTIYVVSYIVLKALDNTRDDVYTVTNTVRDDEGRIIGFRGFCRL